MGREPPAAVRRQEAVCRYDSPVFLVPPWEFYVTEVECPHGFAEAVAEYEDLLRVYPARGYAVVLVPRRSPEERADFVLERL